MGRSSYFELTILIANQLILHNFSHWYQLPVLVLKLNFNRRRRTVPGLQAAASSDVRRRAAGTFKVRVHWHIVNLLLYFPGFIIYIA